MSEATVARVLLDSPLPQLDRLFDYEIPPQFRGKILAGQRVKVPLRSGGRAVDAWVIELRDSSDSKRELAQILEPLGPLSVLTDASYLLARKLADRAAGSASDILRLIVPKRMVRAEKSFIASRADASPAAFALSDAATSLYQEVLAQFPELSSVLASSGRAALRPPVGPFSSSTALTRAMVLLAAVAVSVFAEGKSVVIAVPNYRDVAELHEALSLFVPRDSVMVLDAQQTPSQRYRQYLELLEPIPRIVIGRRSAVYAPVFNLGLLTMWDEGNSSFEEPLSPGVHARDVCLMRNELEKVPLLFAGFSPSADLERLLAIDWVSEVEPVRVLRPRIILDADRDSPQQRFSSLAFKQAKEAIVAGPVLIQVARPGFSPTMLCADCKSPARCEHCQGPLSVPGASESPRCRWCGAGALGWCCQQCSGTKLLMASSGSERTAAEIGRAFPGVKVIISDATHPVMVVPSSPALVIATRGAEPRAVGGFAAVLLLDGNRMLMSDELQIAENCLRWWSAAAALAADSAPVHLIGVSGQIAQAFASWSQRRYVRGELTDRSLLRMPPMVRLARLLGTGAAVDQAIASLREAVPTLAEGSVIGPFAVLGGSNDDDVLFQALIRFDYAQGAKVAETLRSAVVSASLRAKSPKKPVRDATGRSSYRRAVVPLRVRFDVSEMELE